jgi:hypothetical protein
MATRIRSKDDLKPEKPGKPEPPMRAGSATLVFHTAAREDVHDPNGLVELLKAEGIRTGTIRVRNPITPDQWWIPVTAITALAHAARPYATALASVIKAWLKQRRGRQVQLQSGNVKVTANSAADAEQLLAALAKHEKELGSLQVAKAPKKKAKKKTAAKKKKKTP